MTVILNNTRQLLNLNNLLRSKSLFYLRSLTIVFISTELKGAVLPKATNLEPQYCSNIIFSV